MNNKDEKKLSLYLKKYKKTKNNVYISKIYKILLTYSYKIINKNYNDIINKLNLDKKELIHDISTTIIDYIISKNEKFDIKNSWGGYIKLIAKRFIFPEWEKTKYEIDKNESSDDNEKTNPFIDIVYLNNFYENYDNCENINGNFWGKNTDYVSHNQKEENYLSIILKLNNEYEKIKYCMFILTKMHNKNTDALFKIKGFLLKKFLSDKNLL